MFYTAVRYRWADETSDHMLPAYDEDLNRNRMMGMLDDNLDGKLQKAELKGQMGEMLLKYFDVLDKDHDGSLDKAELAEAGKLMGPMRRRQAEAAPPTSVATTGKGGR
jgi:Ca2+-binding EF-hand superfamily protein